ncbi:MAG: hypothetical protein HQL13_02780 [Candidatus Omnitrophica bacterium]|nr:hypothetical protein [Candidatus Omnitrophota bacterium]
MKMVSVFIKKLHEPPSILDTVILCFIALFVVFDPLILSREIRIFEVGLYLPCADAIFKGMVPFRDFFYLRGPFEIYGITAFLALLGKQLSSLYFYFYFGTLLTLFLGIFIGKEMVRTRYFLYALGLVYIVKTFPRIAFIDWGGMRYAWGLMALLLMCRFFKSSRMKFIFWAGVVSAMGLLTSVEIGIYAAVAFLGASLMGLLWRLESRQVFFQSLLFFTGGFGIIFVPFVSYLIYVGAFFPYLETTYVVTTKLIVTVGHHISSENISSFQDAITAMINPNHALFSRMTPAYLYIFVLIFLMYQFIKKTCRLEHLCVLCLGLYGSLMYISAFRSICGPQFEMALQPSKILLFVLLEHFYFFLIETKENLCHAPGQVILKQQGAYKRMIRFGILFLLGAFFIFTFVPCVARLHKRFFIFRAVHKISKKEKLDSLMFFSDLPHQKVDTPRTKGIMTLAPAARDITEVTAFITAHTKDNDIVLNHPQNAAYSFFFNRPFVGKFPVFHLAWVKDPWYSEFMKDLKAAKPKYIIWPKQLNRIETLSLLGYQPNVLKYRAILDFISAHYKVVKVSDLSLIYARQL